MNNKRTIQSTFFATGVLFIVFIFEWYLFKSFVAREMAWSPFLNGDANWYLGHSYIVFDSIIKQHLIPPNFFNDPAGIMVLLFSSLLYMLFGASRLVALSSNLIFYIAWQAAMFYLTRHITKSWIFSFITLGLCLAIKLPFQGDNINPILNIMEYQRDFIVFCLFGIFTAAVLFSDTFRKTKAAVLAGLIAGLMITFRYNMFFHLSGICAVMLAFFLSVYLIRFKHNGIKRNYLVRIKNGILAALSSMLVCFYPLFLAKFALYNHYFAGKIVGPKNKDFIQTYQQGVTNFIQQVIYYPNHIIRHGLGNSFMTTVSAIAVLLFLLVIIYIVFKKLKKSNYKIQANSHLVKSTNNINAYSLFAYTTFLFVCFLFPLLLLTFYPVRSGNVGLFLVAPVITFIVIIFTQIFNKFNISTNKISYLLRIIMVGIALFLGISFQINSYSIVAKSSLNRNDYLEVAHLYDDIISLSKEAGIKQPAVSVNFLENYTLGCCEAITAYRYEHGGELFRVSARLGSDVGRIDKETALRLLQESDILVLCVKEEPLEKRNPIYCDPLSPGLSQVLFSKSIKEFNPEIIKFAREHFITKKRYHIFNRDIELLINKSIRVKPIAIKASSRSSEQFSEKNILESYSPIWHSESGPKYPQWIEFAYKNPVIIKSITIEGQPGCLVRAPSEFYFQGRNDNEQWHNLLYVADAAITDGQEFKTWAVKKKNSYKYYRLYILKNNGSPDFVTIKKVSFDYLNTDNDKI